MPSSTLRRLASCLVLWASLLGIPQSSAAADRAFPLKREDVVVFLGGANIASMEGSGHLETLLTLASPGQKIHFRNLGWEADTVYQQPRDFNFPPLTNLLARFGATVIVMGFGQAESLQGRDKLGEFSSAYESLIDRVSHQTARIVLVTPVPFERPPGELPDLSRRNIDLAAYASAIQAIGTRRGLPVIDLFAALRDRGSNAPALTGNGMHLSPVGHAIAAEAFTRQLSLNIASHPAQEVNRKGDWRDPRMEKIRQAVIGKNRLWFDYWRPMNWAFLNGDRTEQPSSRDHRDPKVRWFPGEMERFVPLIYQAETRIEELSAPIANEPQK